ncbi:MAG: cytochrome c [Gammaproteobacteria bacterium]
MHVDRSPTGRVAAVAFLTAVCALAGIVALAQTEPRTLRDGVFSAAQAARGQRIFKSICVDCHEIEEFTGAGAYLEEHDGKPLWDTFDFVSENMPDDDPGSLKPADYTAVLAYIFSVYGLPAGDADLPDDRAVLEAITITRPGSPGG